MRKRFALQLATPLACAAFLVGCGGSDDANDDRRAQGPLTTAPAEQSEQAQGGAGMQPTVALSGCVDAAPGTGQYVLRNVKFASPGGSDPQRATTAPAGAEGITEGSWVRLRAEEDQIARFAGQRVTLTGVITDSGANTIGTSGTEGTETPSGDKSQAAGSEHYSDRVKTESGRMARDSMANGTAAEMRVHAMEGSGERCPADQTKDSR